MWIVRNLIKAGMNFSSLTVQGKKLRIPSGSNFDLDTIDGGSGEVFLGRVETSTPEPDGDLAKLLSWKETV